MCYKINMKKTFSKILILLLLILQTNIGLCIETIELENIQKEEIKYNKQIEKDTKNLVIDSEDTLKDIIELQKIKDGEDLDYLWKQTVESSQLIKFALKKLSIPEDQRRLHSSIMSKTLSSIISGAAFLPMLMGQNSLIQSASFSASRIATSLINKPETPQTELMTDTELIELASVIEKLQNDLLNSYYNYKNELIHLKNVR